MPRTLRLVVVTALGVAGLSLASPVVRAESAAGAPLDELIPPTREELAQTPQERAPARPIFEERAPPPALGMSDVVGPILKTFLMLGVVLAIAYLSLHKGLGKLVERQSVGKRVKVVERVGLDPKRALYLVELDGKQMLLGAGDQGIVLLKDVDKPPPEATRPGLGARFAEALERRPDKPVTTVGLPRAADDLGQGAQS